MLYTIEEIKEKVKPVAEKYHVKEMYLFGSYARGQADEQSDLDFVVQEDESNFLIQNFYKCLHELENIFQLKIDLLLLDSVKNATKYMPNRLLQAYERDKVELYERVA